MRHTQLVNYTLYQIGWFACVLGAASQRPWTGCLIAMILVGVHLALSVERVLEVRLVVLATAVGAAVEMIQIAAGTYRFTSGTVNDALPPPGCWPCGRSLRRRFDSVCAVWSRGRCLRCCLERLAVQSRSSRASGWVRSPCSHRSRTSLLRLSISWAIALVVFSAVVRRIAPERGADYRHA